MVTSCAGWHGVEHRHTDPWPCAIVAWRKAGEVTAGDLPRI